MISSDNFVGWNLEKPLNAEFDDRIRKLVARLNIPAIRLLISCRHKKMKGFQSPENHHKSAHHNPSYYEEWSLSPINNIHRSSLESCRKKHEEKNLMEKFVVKHKRRTVLGLMLCKKKEPLKIYCVGKLVVLSLLSHIMESVCNPF